MPLATTAVVLDGARSATVGAAEGKPYSIQRHCYLAKDIEKKMNRIAGRRLVSANFKTLRTFALHMSNQAFLEYISQFISEHKHALFDENLRWRTRHITVAIENIFQPHNASAVLRTCDCFGVQDVHIIENDNEYYVNPDVALGASKWLNLHRYNQKKNNTVDCINALKAKGYHIVATTPHEGSVTIDEIPLNQKTALLFGTEKDGLTDIALEHADSYAKIPMYGFTESFNISVSAAIILHHLTEKLRKSDIDWELSEEEITDIRLEWMKQVVARPDILEKDFYANRS